MILMALDLEFAQPCGTIIQVGIAIGNTNAGTIFAEEGIPPNGILFSKHWNVHSNTQVTPYITALTGITQEDVDEGHSLEYVYAEISALHEEYHCEMNPLVWGGGDTELLRAQLGMDKERWIFGRRFIDAKTVYIARQMAQGKVGYGGLSNSMKKMGLKFEGEKHRASTDAENTFRMYHKLLGEFK